VEGRGQSVVESDVCPVVGGAAMGADVTSGVEVGGYRLGRTCENEGYEAKYAEDGREKCMFVVVFVEP
jgi:hypothetical protein